jgi:hypothetical protein
MDLSSHLQMEISTLQLFFFLEAMETLKADCFQVRDCLFSSMQPSNQHGSKDGYCKQLQDLLYQGPLRAG